jgi:hypothetical protein
MARSNPYAGFDREALKAVLDALGIQYPSDASVATLGGMLQDAESIVDADVFQQALAAANTNPAPAKAPVATAEPTGFVEVTGVGGIVSDTWNPNKHVELGR